MTPLEDAMSAEAESFWTRLVELLREISVRRALETMSEQIRFLSVELPGRVWNAIPRGAMVPLIVVAVVFWPLLVSLLYASLTASTWILWLLTSFVLGILQVLYVAYQFVMITADLCGLSVLKSYSMARNFVLTYLNLKKKSRRRLWQERLKNSGSYENFLKIRIEPKEVEEVTTPGAKNCLNSNIHLHSPPRSQSFYHKQTPSPPERDSALPPLRPTHFRSNSLDGKRSASFSFDGTGASSGSLTSASTPSSTGMPRPRSFGQISNLFRHYYDDFDEYRSGHSYNDVYSEERANATRQGSPVDHSPERQNRADPIVEQELGERTAYLLVTTTERLLDARRHAERCSHNKEEHNKNNAGNNSNNKVSEEQEAWNRLKYLLSAIVKRNHLHLDNILVDNARTVSFTGRYGLTSQSRQVIRKYYEQVQKALDLLADGPSVSSSSSTNNATTNVQPLIHEEENCSNPVASATLASPSPSPPSSTSSLSAMNDQFNEELSDRLRVLRKMKHNMGRTALMLSGGGAQAMYHIGIVRALI